MGLFKDNKILRFITSVPVLTLAMLICTEVFLRNVNIPAQFGYRSSDSWLIADRIEECLKTRPEVGIIGSSLMFGLNQDGSGRHFYTGRYTPYLQKLLRDATEQDVRCLNLATGRQTIAEAYLVTKAITKKPDYPKVIIYGLIMRDFVDEKFAGEWQSESFDAIAPYSPADPGSVFKIYSQKGTSEFLLSHFSYIYRDRSALRNFLAANSKDFIDHNLPLDRPYVRMGDDSVNRPSKEGHLIERTTPQEMEILMAKVIDKRPENVKKVFKDLFAVMHGYAPRNALRIQNYYMEQLIKLCRSKDIQLVIVNMPISNEFRNLGHPEDFVKFAKFLKGLSEEKGFPLIDISFDKDFTEDCFVDGLHLDYKGSKILARKLVQLMQQDYPYVMSTMADQARNNAGKYRK